MIFNRYPLVGLEEVKKHVSAECKKAALYKNSGRTPKCMIIHLSKGQGRTTLLNHIALEYKKAEVLKFHNGLDDFLEIDFSGDYDDYILNQSIIEDASIFGSYDGVVGMDASELCKNKTGKQWTDFTSLIKGLSKSACIVFFVPYTCKKADEELIKVIKDTLKSQVVELNCNNYTIDEYLSIVIKTLESNNVIIDDLDIFINAIKSQLNTEIINTISDAMSIIEMLFSYVDYDNKSLMLKASTVKTIDLNAGGKTQ